jgi:N-ethylmaleimide reductase
MSHTLYQPFRLGRLTLKNRIVMAPMTRTRALGNLANPLIAQYYQQRSEAGLIITEGTSPSPNGLGYCNIPGLFNAEQAQSWRGVTDAVHAEGTAIFVQLMHTGRVSHEANLPAGARVLAPSAVVAPGQMFTIQQGMQPHSLPTEMTEADIEKTLQEYTDAAALAIDAGFDGVELHGANGYLIDQFLNLAANQRTDRWGGSIENRARFAVEAARRAVARIGADRVGIRFSPYGANNGQSAQGDADHEALYGYLATEMAKLGLAYVHVVDHSAMGAPPVSDSVKALIRKNFGGTYILSGGYDAARGQADLDAGKGELVAFGRPFIANPRLVTKLRNGAALLPLDPATLYAPGPEGYVDYPIEG